MMTKKVKVHYTGTLDDGTVFDSSDGRDPLEFEVGSGQVIKGFDDAVASMKPGEEKEIKLESKDAYGDNNPDLIREFPKDKIPPEAQEGSMLMMQTPHGQMPAKVAKIEGDKVFVDLNHPLAGKNLTFKIKLIE